MTEQRQSPATDTEFRCRVGDVVRRGHAVTIDQPVEETAVAAAVRGTETTDQIAVDGPTPQPVHDHVGYIHPDMGLRTRTALARAARSLGLETPYDEEIRATREERASLSVDGDPETRRACREAVAGRTAETEKLREDVATLRGKLQAVRANDGETEAITSELEATIKELSEVETDAAAARQRLDRCREAARERRDIRERCRRLDDQVENLRRKARGYLVDQLTDRYAEAVAALEGAGPADPFEAEPVTAGLAVARVGTLAAPLVLAVDGFGSAEDASEWLDTPVLKV